MSHNAEVIKGGTAYQNGKTNNQALQAAGAIGVLRHRHKKSQRKKKLSKFERKFTALGPLLKPEQKRIDYVLVHKPISLEDEIDPEKKKIILKKEDMRRRFENALKCEGFSVKAVEIDETVYKKLHCPFKRLCKEAEVVKLELPLKGCEKYPIERTTIITELMEEHLETDNEVDFISAPFKMNKIDLFDGYDNPTFFFRPSLRSLLTHHILINLDIRSKEEADGSALQKKDSSVLPPLKPNVLRKRDKKKKVVTDFIHDLCSCCPHLFTTDKEVVEEDFILSKMGLKYLLMKEAYTDAYILHEDSELSKLNEKQGDKKKRPPSIADVDIKPSLVTDPRKELDETWTVWWKFQPLWKIRNYFGEKIAMYFAWCGMLLTTLWIPVLFGLACFIYGVVESSQRANDNDEPTPPNLTAREELRVRMGNLYNTLRGSFDNNVTPYFALVICLWGTVFLELWKRHDARLAYEWDVDQFEQNEPDRPQFFGTKVKKDPVTQEDNWFYPFKRQILKFCLSASALIFMICIVCISVAAVIVYRVIISVDYCTELSSIECLFATTIISAVLNAISILLLGKFYDWVALKLTEWENHRTQTQYDNALIIKLFAFSFANSYASCFYIAFFRGRFDTFGVFGLGAEYNDECEGGNCMAQLSFQVLILMLAKPFPKFFKDIILPFLKTLWRKRPACCQSICCKNQVEDEEKKSVKDESPSLKKSKMFLETERLKPDLGDFTLPEYTEKVIMYGFLMLFAASFPLAPLIAMAWLAIDIRIDAKRLLWLNRRPISFIAQDIGMWYSILNFVNLIGVISNGFLIAFTSSWGDKYSLTTQLWICIGFEHIVFALKFILAYLIPDVPKDVRLAIRREKYQVAKKFEDKGKLIDYTELVPAGTVDDKEDLLYDDKLQRYFSAGSSKMVPVKYRVREDSANYADFEEDLEPEEAPGPPSAVLETVAEEQSSIPQEQPKSFLGDSQGTTSLRHVNPEGTHLLEHTEPTDAPVTKLSKNTRSAIGREQSRTDFASAPPVFKTAKEMEEEAKESTSANDMAMAKQNMSEENDTQC